jgi:glycosyltransferase involved in cell wall biosynthesis
MEMGGAERLVYNLARKLDRNLFNPSVAWFFGNSILKEFKDLDIPLYHIPKIKKIDIRAMFTLGEVISKNNINLVNAHHFMSMIYSFYGSKIRNRVNLIYTEHSEWEIEHLPWKWKIMGRLLLNRADAAVGVSAAVSGRIQKSFKTAHSKTFTVLNGVSLESFTNGKDKLAFREELGLSSHDKVIGVVANFRRVKNHIFLVKAFAELRKIYNNVKLLLIGQGFEFDPENSEQEIREFVDNAGLKKEILFLGFRSDIPALLNLMDIFCLTSFKEGLPISLIEAMAAGLPVVGTDADGIRDVIVPNKNGFLVSLGDVMGLKVALLALLRDGQLRQKMREESRSLAMKTYSLDQCIAQYQDLFISENRGSFNAKF